jgi:hypothetical protein
MRNTAAMSRIDQDQLHTSGAADSFALELSDLCRRHGVGLSGEPTLFVMERDDYAFNYGVDARSRLIWGCGE